MTTAAIDPTMRVQTLIALTEELTAIIVRENEILVSRRPKELLALQPDKARLAAAYAQSIRCIATDRSSVAAVGEGLIAKLRELTRIFEERAQHQRALLEGARAASESVLKAVAEEAGKTAAPSYGARRADAAPLVIDDRA